MKEEIRMNCLERRSTLSPEQMEQFSSSITDGLFTFLNDKQKIGIYMPMSMEVDVTSLLFLNYSFYAPRMKSKTEMDFVRLEGAENLANNHVGILEPQGKEIIEPKDLDVIIIPIVGFDAKLNRLGYGKGYYDRYLASCNALKIGVAFDIQKTDEIPIDKYDIPLDYIMTESSIYSFKT